MQFFPHSILNFPHSVGHFLTSTSSLFSLFLVGGFSTPLNKISSSMGRMTSHIYPYTIHYYIYPIYEMENKIHVPNHQPGLVVQPHGYCYNPTPLRRCGDFSTKPWRLRHECRITARVGCHALLPPWIRGIWKTTFFWGHPWHDDQPPSTYQTHPLVNIQKAIENGNL